MEDTVKALEEKVALLEAKLGKKSESKAGASGSSPTTSPENPLRIKPESFSATSVRSSAQGRQGRNESLESGQGPRACFKCGSPTHFIRDCPHQVRPDQGNGRWAGRSRK